MAGRGCLGLGLFCWVLCAVPVGPQPASSIPGALTTLTPPPQSEASMLSLNLGLNFKLHLRGPAAVWGNPVTETQALSPGPGQEPGEEVASGLRNDPLWELLVGPPGNSPPEWGSAEGSAMPWASSLSPESASFLSGPTHRPTTPYQPRMGPMTWATALTATAPPSSVPRSHHSELELKFDVALRAGAAPTLGHRTLPLLPSLRASLAEIAGRLGPFGFFGTTLSPLRNFSGLSPPGITTSPNSASRVSESPGFFGTTLSPSLPSLERKLSSPSLLDLAAFLSTVSAGTAMQHDLTIPTSGSDAPSGSSLGNPSVQPECGLETCSMDVGELPDREVQPPSSPRPLFFLNLEADWAEARACWGLAWEAHVYGAGALFGLVAMLALLALALLPWRCPPALQGYEVLHALGYGGQPGLEGPWPWWAFQLGLRLGEVGVALPLALLGLYPTLCSPRLPPRCWAKIFRLSPGHAAPLLPGGWVTGPQDKEPLGSAIARGDAELLQLCALAGPGPDLLLQGCGCTGFEGASDNPVPSPASSPCSECTVDFRPPSPINLRRSIEEALCSEAMLAPGLFQGPTFGEALPGLSLYRTASLGTKTRAGHNGRSEEALSSPAAPDLPSPGAWPAESSASSGSLCGLSRDSSSMLLCSSPDRPLRCPLVCVLSPPRPSGSSLSLQASGSYQVLSPPSHDSPEPAPELQAEEALLQEQFLDACRQIDELSVGSDTIDL
ncbi:Proline-rich transmembrane protein 4 [Fukomys damarensis]|uniref:Proline-rich transmembrane protein 4 n=1 Tax=Fukomys damarensis TaxID=885580 RepID=A0A091DFQ4_FUKDA|nr:Proline-rich transmembrane protein 4 [Fukomys damarensis]